MKILFKKTENIEEKSSICSQILAVLPLWFSIPESNAEYSKNVKVYDFYAVYDGDEVIGFASLKRNNQYVLELYVLGIKPEYHRKGIGKKMMKFIKKIAKKEKHKYLEVKTLDESRQSEEYKRTRLFYLKCGFIPLDVLWNEWGTIIRA